MRPRRLPEILKVGDTLYKLTVFKVVSKDERNRPEECVMVPDDRGVEIVGGEEFMTAYVPAVMYRGKR